MVMGMCYSFSQVNVECRQAQLTFNKTKHSDKVGLTCINEACLCLEIREEKKSIYKANVWAYHGSKIKCNKKELCRFLLSKSSNKNLYLENTRKGKQ